jgi:hypothetical protein
MDRLHQTYQWYDAIHDFNATVFRALDQKNPNSTREAMTFDYDWAWAFSKALCQLQSNLSIKASPTKNYIA